MSPRPAPAPAAKPIAMPARAPLRLPLVLLAALIALPACESACGKAHELTESVGESLISVELEQELGAQMAAQFRREVTLHPDPVVQRYIEDLGGELVAHAQGIPEGMAFEFRVIDAPDVVNAVAMPGGHIYVFSGLLRAVDSEAELAGVLAHEIAHVAERHVVAQLVTAMGIQAIRALALGDEGGELARVVADFATMGALGAFSRTAEREADTLGIRTLVAAGWDPRGYATFFEKLGATAARPDLVTRFASTHPDPAERAARARALAAELEATPTRTDTGTLERIVARLGR